MNSKAALGLFVFLTGALYVPIASAQAHDTVVPASTETDDASSLTITINTQGTYEDVHIAPYNVREDAKADAGAKRKTVALEVVVGDAEKEARKLRLGEGESFKAGNLSFRVVSIDKSEVKLAVTK
jgi:hypothetical protein